MEKYRIVEGIESTAGAGGKARDDISIILDKMNFKRLNIYKKEMGASVKNRIINQLRFLKKWIYIYKIIRPNSILLIQAPFVFNYVFERNILSNLEKLKNKKNIKLVILIHDVDELRSGLFDKKDFFKRKKQFDYLLNIADKIIVHNNVMEKYFFEKKHIKKDKVIVLSIFDYLVDKSLNSDIEFSKNVAVAGNLDVRKAKYLRDLKKIDITFELFGPNYSLNSNKNIKYHGIVAPDRLPELLNNGFGLIWDGESIKTCTGIAGNYLKYNNPHKLSLYISSGLPIIIWKEAAEATFIKKNNIGFEIDSLEDLPKIMQKLSKKEYTRYRNNVKKISLKLRQGYFTKKAVNKAIKELEVDE